MAQQAETVALPKRLPLAIEPSNRGDTVTFDARLVNGYMETKRAGDGVEYWIYERPGMDQHSRPPAGNATGRGMFNWLGDVYSVFGTTVYKNGVALAPGTVDGTNGNYRFDQCLGATPRMVLGNGVKGYYYDSGGGLVNITDVDFPTSFVKGWGYLNGPLYVGTGTAHLRGSDSNDPAAWDPLDDILAHIEPDLGMAVGKQLVYIVFPKQWSTEVFYDAGNATGSSLGRVEASKAPWGCLSSDSMRELDGALIWLGSSKNGSPEVIMMNNLKTEPISTKPIERLLQQADLSGGVFSWTFKQRGHRFYVLTIKNENLTLAFDLDERTNGVGGWTQWTDTNGNYLPIVDSCMDSSMRTLVQHESNGRIYILDSSYASDDGDAIQVDVYTPNFDGGTRRNKTLGMFTVVSDQLVGSKLGVRFNDHDFNALKWTNFRYLELNRQNPQLPDCGTFKRRVTNLRHRSATVRMPRIQAVELQMDIGTL